MKDAILSVRLDAELARLLRLKAKQDGVTLSDLMRDALKDALFDYDKVTPIPPIPWAETRTVNASNVVWLDPPRQVA